MKHFAYALLCALLAACGTPAEKDADAIIPPDPLSAHLAERLMAFVLPAPSGDQELNMLIAKATAAAINRPVTSDEMFADPRQFRLNGVVDLTVIHNTRHLYADWFYTDSKTGLGGHYQAFVILSAEGAQDDGTLSHLRRADMQALAVESARLFWLQPLVQSALAAAGADTQSEYQVETVTPR